MLNVEIICHYTNRFMMEPWKKERKDLRVYAYQKFLWPRESILKQLRRLNMTKRHAQSCLLKEKVSNSLLKAQLELQSQRWLFTVSSTQVRHLQRKEASMSNLSLRMMLSTHHQLEVHNHKWYLELQEVVCLIKDQSLIVTMKILHTLTKTIIDKTKTVILIYKTWMMRTCYELNKKI